MQTYEEIKRLISSKDLIESDYQFRFDSYPSSNKEPYEVADSYTTRLGFTPIGRQWIPIQKDEAVAYLSRILHRSLAYGIEMFSAHTAQFIAEQTCSLTNPYKSTFLANGTIHDTGFSYNPIGSASFELALVFMDDEHIGFFYIEDED